MVVVGPGTPGKPPHRCSPLGHGFPRGAALLLPKPGVLSPALRLRAAVPSCFSYLSLTNSVLTSVQVHSWHHTHSLSHDENHQHKQDSNREKKNPPVSKHIRSSLCQMTVRPFWTVPHPWNIFQRLQLSGPLDVSLPWLLGPYGPQWQLPEYRIPELGNQAVGLEPTIPEL